MIIGIGGISRSGKSFLSEYLKKRFVESGKSVCILAQDDFVFQEERIPKIKDHIDWEVPESIDWEKFINTTVEFSKTHDLVIIEGLMVFWHHELQTLCDKQIYISLSKNEFISRKQIDLRWGREPDWYIEYIWDSFLKYGHIPEGSVSTISIRGEDDFDLDGIFQEIISLW